MFEPFQLPFVQRGLIEILILSVGAGEHAVRQLQETGQVAQAPLGEALRHHWREILLAAGSRLSENSCFYLFSAYALSYGKSVLRVDESVVLTAVNVAAAVEFTGTAWTSPTPYGEYS